MTQYEKGLTNLSYTNKDFSTIYPELLDLAKQLSYKWDPTVSTESDPGNVLIKLNALMADKLNYNIDKNALETLPLSVTQEQNARQIFDQCGYRMKWYQAATTTLTFRMVAIPEIPADQARTMSGGELEAITDSDIVVCKIPRFTIVSDSNSEYLFTTVEDALVASDHIDVVVNALQGTPVDYMINGSDLITTADLDYDRRLYFPESDIAENGIFITNVNAATQNIDNYADWIPVENLSIQTYGSTVYKFGLSDDGTRCYIEFPTDIDTLIGNGLRIKYIRTSGYAGNVTRRCLSKFFGDTSSVSTYLQSYSSQLETSCKITEENITVTNLFAVTDGRDPETIDEAYRNYEKVKNTFSTLVSTQDYTNFLYTNKNISNGIVCDRVSDPSTSFEVLETADNFKRVHHVQYTSAEENTNVKLQPFDLRLYGFSYTTDVTSKEQFEKTFTLIPYDSVDPEFRRIEDDIEEIKSLQHNLIPPAINEPLLIKNKFPIDCRVIPQYNLSVTEHEDVVRNISAALYRALTSRNIDMGKELEYEYVYDTILNSDSRIKAVALDPLEYQTYVMYYDGNEFKEVRVDTGYQATDDLVEKFRKTIFVKSVLAGKTPLYKPADNFTYSVSHDDTTLANNFTRVTTETHIKVDNDSKTTDVIRSNENIVLTAPSLITKGKYSSGPKYIHNISQDIPADGTYQLKENEYMYVFWKTGENDTDPYLCKRHSKGTIITPTFNIERVNGSGDNLDSLLRNGNSYRNYELNCSSRELNAELLQYCQDDKTIYSIYQDIPSQVSVKGLGPNASKTTLTLFEFISLIAGETCTLSGTREIDLKEVNKVTVNTVSPNVYWFTNNKVFNNGKYYYKLFETNDKTYVLGPQEYLLYSNKQQTQLYMVGEGTTITIDKSATTPWTVEVISYDEFLQDPLHSIEDRWFTLPTGTNLVVTENEYYQFGPGCLVTFNNDWTASYITSDPKTVKGQISYRETMSSVPVNVPQRIFETAELCWSIYSVLNLHSDNNVCVMYPNQKYTFSTNEQTEFEYGTLPKGTNEDPKSDARRTVSNYLQLSSNVSIYGGKNIDVTTLDLTTNNVKPLNVYKYKIKQSSSDSNIIYDDVTNVDFSSTATNVDCKVPDGTYILPVTVTFDLTNVTNKSDVQVDITFPGVESAVAFTYASPKQFIKIKVDTDDTGNQIIITGADSNSKGTVSFGKMLRVDENTSDSNKQKAYVDLVDIIDKDMIFDRTYQPTADDLIQDPLHSTEFFNSKHPYNKFTICQWDVNDTNNKLKLITKVK